MLKHPCIYSAHLVLYIGSTFALSFFYWPLGTLRAVKILYNYQAKKGMHGMMRNKELSNSASFTIVIT